MVIADAPTVLLGEGDVRRSRVQIAKTGRFVDRRYGRFAITPQDFAAWIKNFKALSVTDGKPGIPVDIDHSPEKKGETEAAGWIVDLDTNGSNGETATPSELWATVEWNSLGVQLIEDHRYAYLSPSYKHNYRDETGRAHGTALVGAGLTNRPFLTMATVALSAALEAQAVGAIEEQPEPTPLLYLSTVASNSGNSWVNVTLDQATLSALTSKARSDLPASAFVFPKEKRYPIHDLAHARNALARSSGKPEESKVRAAVYRRYPQLRKDGDQHDDLSDSPERMADLSNIAKQLGLTEDAEETQILEKLTELQAEPKVDKTLDQLAADEGKIVLSADNVRELTADAAAGKAASEELRIQKFDAAFDKALDEGRATPAMKDGLRKLYDLDADVTLAQIDAQQVMVNVDAAGGRGGKPAVDPTLAKDLENLGDNVVLDDEAAELHSRVLEVAREKNIDYGNALDIVMAEVG